VQEQDRQDEPFLQPAERDRLALVDHLEWPENPVLHQRVLPLPKPRRKQPEPVPLPECGRRLTHGWNSRVMDHPPHSSAPDTVSCHGEVWTDARGYATVRLPVDAGPLEPPVEYELHDLEPASSARITAGLEKGHFTVATEQPHVKVAWRISGRSAADPRHRQQKEE
jgi:hypothetical protein